MELATHMGAQQTAHLPDQHSAPSHHSPPQVGPAFLQSSPPVSTQGSIRMGSMEPGRQALGRVVTGNFDDDPDFGQMFEGISCINVAALRRLNDTKLEVGVSSGGCGWWPTSPRWL